MTIATTLVVLILIVAVVTAQTVDLSDPWVTGPLYNKNKAYCTIQAAMAPCYIRGYVVIQNGLLVAEGYTDGNAQNGIYDAYSATKSWGTFFMGVLVDEGKVSITDTLNDIFDADADWVGVEGATEKKTITVLELLTMTSGLVAPSCSRGDEQESLQEVLNQLDFDSNQRGKFNYMSTNHMIAQIVARRSGMTPREFANSVGIFDKLGITDSDFEWDTFGGVEGSGYGLKTNPRIMAKLGQLYLQNGESAPGVQLVASAWVQESETNQLAAGDSSISVNTGLNGYGYQWYNFIDGGSGAYAGIAMAAGFGGQLIVYLPVSNTTIAIMSTGSCTSAESAKLLLTTIVENLGDLTVEQTTCGASFSYWRYYAEHSGKLLSAGLRDLPNVVLGRNLV